MKKSSFFVGDLVMPIVSTQLFSAIIQKSVGGSAFSPQLGPHKWNPEDMGIIIDEYEMPFHDKRLYRIMINSGGTGWLWEERLSSFDVNNDV